jgi:hypothetical protein
MKSNSQDLTLTSTPGDFSGVTGRDHRSFLEAALSLGLAKLAIRTPTASKWFLRWTQHDKFGGS